MSELTCNDALRQLWEYIDEELDADSSDRLRDHLERCSACFPQYDFQRAFRAFLAAKCRLSAPPELRRRIFLDLLEEERRG